MLELRKVESQIVHLSFFTLKDHKPIRNNIKVLLLDPAKNELV